MTQQHPTLHRRGDLRGLQGPASRPTVGLGGGDRPVVGIEALDLRDVSGSSFVRKKNLRETTNKTGGWLVFGMLINVYKSEYKDIGIDTSTFQRLSNGF